jgi:hypothetical protein
MTKIKSSNFLIITEGCTSLPDDDAAPRMLQTHCAYETTGHMNESSLVGHRPEELGDEIWTRGVGMPMHKEV